MSWGVAPGFNEAAPLALSMHEATGFTSDDVNRFFVATAEMQSRELFKNWLPSQHLSCA